MSTWDDNTAGQLAAAKPDEASADREQRRARLAEQLFGVEPEPRNFGRFMLLDRIGEGGMGSVHGAYDPQLDRRVALKLLRAGQVSEAARTRMQREAQALARLSHPNVVAVYEAGVLDEQVFIVMEYVVGKTLRDWVVQDGPKWREVLDIYLAAGRGLAAAHAAGVIHRDFKPDNAILGDDGRVRVLDFGLARGVGEAREQADTVERAAEGSAPVELRSASEASEQVDIGRDETMVDVRGNGDSASGLSSSSSSFEQRLTMTGAVLGTPAYMAPEQFLGGKVGPSADQYSFCVALYEAVYGRRPYRAESFEDLRARVLRGEIDEPSAGEVPRWVFAALRRGLASNPDARYDSMEELLAELGRDRQRVRKRVLAVGGALLLAGLTGAVAWTLGDAGEAGPAQCRGGEQRLSEVWGDPQRSAVEQAIAATGRAYAEEVGPRVRAGLDDYGRRWVEMYDGACQLHLRGEQSDAMFDKRLACLERRHTAARSAVEVLRETEAGSLAKAVELVEQLPSLSDCANVELLEAEVEAPRDPALAEAVEVLGKRAIKAEALEHFGSYSQALAEIEVIVAEAEALAYRPSLAQALLQRGRILMHIGQREQALEPLRRAATLALESGMDSLAVEAIARRIYVEGTSTGEAVGVLRELPFAEALTQRVADAGFVHTLLLNNAGVVHLARGERDRARTRLEQALAIRDAQGVEDLELNAVLLNLALVSEPAQRRVRSARAVAELEAVLGASHPLTLNARLMNSHHLEDAREAFEQRAPVCELYVRYHEEQIQPSSECLYTLAFLHAQRGELVAAADTFARVEAMLEGHDEGMRRTVAEIAGAHAQLYRGQHELARTRLDAVVRELEAEQQWWVNRDLGHALVGRARAELAVMATEEARASLSTAIARFEEIGALSSDEDVERARADAQQLLAQLEAPEE